MPIAPRRSRAGALLRWSLLALAIMWTRGIVMGVATSYSGSASEPVIRSKIAFLRLSGAHPIVQDLGLAVYAGITEELAALSFVMVFGFVLVLEKQIRPLPDYVYWSFAVATGLVGVAWRVMAHMHQGVPLGLSAGVWGFGYLLIFLRTQSIVPLMIGHGCYDFFIAFNDWIPGRLGSPTYLAAGACVLALGYGGSRLCDVGASSRSSVRA